MRFTGSKVPELGRGRIAWLSAHVSKTCRVHSPRGFESLPLRLNRTLLALPVQTAGAGMNLKRFFGSFR